MAKPPVFKPGDRVVVDPRLIAPPPSFLEFMKKYSEDGVLTVRNQSYDLLSFMECPREGLCWFSYRFILAPPAKSFADLVSEGDIMALSQRIKGALDAN